MRKFFFLFVLLATDSYCQIEITGTVYNLTTKSPLVGCSVYNLTSQLGTIANEEGKYLISAKKGDLIQYSYIGMVVESRYVLDATTAINIELHYVKKRIKDVIITSENLAQHSILYNKKYGEKKHTIEIAPKSAKQYSKEAGFNINKGTLAFSPISMIYYSLPRVRRRLDAIIDINKLDASKQKYSLDFISLVTQEEDEEKLQAIRSYCYFPHDQILNSSYYELGLLLQDCYIDYLQDKNKPKLLDSSAYDFLPKDRY